MFYATGLPGWMRFAAAVAPVGAPMPPQRVEPGDERRMLEERIAAMQVELDAVKQRLNDICDEPE